MKDHNPIVTTKLWELAQETLDQASHRKKATVSRPKELNDENYPYRNQLFCTECGHCLMRRIRVDRVLWECSGKERFSKDFCSGVSVTDDEVQA